MEKTKDGINIPRVMSTQHPDNVSAPFFSESSVLHGEDEIKEAFYSYSHLRCTEQLWDYEGKEVDNFVVKKLLTRYEQYFKKNVLGKDVFLTLRVPNPEVEKNEAKILLETLESIPRCFDTAKTFYGDDIAPIFEVAVPMVQDYKTVSRVANYYSRFVHGKAQKSLIKDDITIDKWIGNISPEKIRVIPLLETRDAMMNADKIALAHMKETKTEDYQRVWLARSDPALNYSNTSALLTAKIALQKLSVLQEKTSVSILPILGCGSAPFRGNLKPTNVNNILAEYPSVQTFTIQSAFKYDFDERQVISAIDTMQSIVRKKSQHIDEKIAEKILTKTADEYSEEIKFLAPLINQYSEYVPERRKRKLHIGLFGYSRSHKGISLPRAIKFCSALYSYGLPPEILGLSALTENELDALRDMHKNFDSDMKDSLKYLNLDNIKIYNEKFARKVEDTIKKINVDYEIDAAHKKITSIIIKDMGEKNTVAITENIQRAAWIRQFLG